jgi:hypothetical protein
MFGDWNWLAERTHSQEEKFERFLKDNKERRVAVIEMGAGSAIPTIRATSEWIGWSLEKARILRINPREPEIQLPHLALPYGALDCQQRIREALETI